MEYKVCDGGVLAWVVVVVGLMYGMVCVRVLLCVCVCVHPSTTQTNLVV